MQITCPVDLNQQHRNQKAMTIIRKLVSVSQITVEIDMWTTCDRDNLLVEENTKYHYSIRTDVFILGSICFSQFLCLAL